VKLKNKFINMITGALAAGSTMVIACAYGPVDESWLVANGTVSDATGFYGNPVSSAEVCLNLGNTDYCVLTDSLGEFEISVPGTSRDLMLTEGSDICVNDVDGTVNGTFTTVCQNMPAGEIVDLGLVVELN
jgi:hypothetical protein